MRHNRGTELCGAKSGGRKANRSEAREDGQRPPRLSRAKVARYGCEAAVPGRPPEWRQREPRRPGCTKIFKSDECLQSRQWIEAFTGRQCRRRAGVSNAKRRAERTALRGEKYAKGIPDDYRPAERESRRNRDKAEAVEAIKGEQIGGGPPGLPPITRRVSWGSGAQGTCAWFSL